MNLLVWLNFQTRWDTFRRFLVISPFPASSSEAYRGNLGGKLSQIELILDEITYFD